MPRIRKKKPRIMYPGSTIMQNYGESGEKGFLLWDIKSRDSWGVDFHPVLNNHPFVTVDWTGDVNTTIGLCIQAHPSGGKYRIRSSRVIDPKTQHKLSGQLRRELKAREVVYKVDNKNASPTVAAKITEKLEVLDLSKPAVHKELLREYASDELYTSDFWEEVDKVIDATVPQLERSQSLGKRWSIRKLQFSNLFGYGEDNVIDFSKTHGLVGLFGPNRAGKSSIPGTLMYSLYNSNDRGLTTNAHVVNYRKSWGSANLEFTVDGAPYRLERMSKRYISRRNGTNGAKTDLNLFSLDSDGEVLADLSGEQRRETEKDVKDLIGSPDEFMMTTFAAQGDMNAFIKMGSTDRKKLLSSFMGLDILDDLYKIIKSEADGVKALIKRGAQDWDGQISQHQNKIRDLEEKKRDLDTQKDTINEKIRSIEIDISNTSKDEYIDPNTFLTKERQLEKFRKTLSSTVDTLRSFEEDIDQVQTKIEKYETFRQKFPLESIQRRVELYKSLQNTLLTTKHALQTELNVLRTQQRSVQLLEEVPCGDSFPTCKFISDSHKNKSLIQAQQARIDELNIEYTSLEEQVSELAEEDLKNRLAKYERLVKEIGTLEFRKSSLEGQIELSKQRIDRSQSDIQALEQEVAILKLKMQDNDSEGISELQKIVSSYRNQLKHIERELYSTASSVGLSQARIEKLQSDRDQYTTLEGEWKVYDFLLRATGWRGIPTFVMTKQIPLINAELNKILRDVTGFTIELEVDEKNTDLFINYGDTRRPLECGSGMEKMVSSMALRVALSNVSNLSKSDMFIVDEGFGALDAENVEAVTSLLHRLKDYYRLILIISHVDVIKDNVDDVIIIERNGQDSKVVYN